MLEKKVYSLKHMKKGQLLIKNTTQNLFITILNSKNQVKRTISLGYLGFSEYDLYSNIALRRLAQLIIKQLKIYNYTQVSLLLYGWTKPIKKFLRVFKKEKSIFWTSIFCKLIIPHNGCKLKKLKRR